MRLKERRTSFQLLGDQQNTVVCNLGRKRTEVEQMEAVLVMQLYVDVQTIDSSKASMVAKKH